MTISTRDALVYRQVMTMRYNHAVRYSDKMLQRGDGLQAGNDNKYQSCSGVQ